MEIELVLFSIDFDIIFLSYFSYEMIYPLTTKSNYKAI
jgi:hypothetical protein